MHRKPCLIPMKLSELFCNAVTHAKGIFCRFAKKSNNDKVHGPTKSICLRVCAILSEHIGCPLGVPISYYIKVKMYIKNQQ